VTGSASVFEMGAASTSTAGLGVVWSRWPAGKEPGLALYDGATGLFTTKTIAAGTPTLIARHVAMTAIPDGRFAVAWTGAYGVNPDYLYLSVGPETASPFTVAVDSNVRSKGMLAISPFFDNQIAIARGELDYQSDTHYRVLVEIYTLAGAPTASFDVVAPDDTLEMAPQLILGSDSLLVLMNQSLTTYPKTAISLGRIKRTDASSTIAGKTLVTLSGTTIPPSALLDGTTGIRLLYDDGQEVVLAPFDLDGNSTGGPTTVTPIGVASTRALVVREGGSDRLLWSDAGGSLLYAALDASDHALSPVTLAPSTALPNPVAFLRDSRGNLMIGWFTYAGAAYLSPICP
jgi:hypothetical protein